MKTIFLTLEQILAIHDDQIERYGGSHGIRDIGLLESAVFRPQSTFDGEELYPNTFEKAAVLLHSLLLNHVFMDGNKRTSIVSILVFLELNGYLFTISQKRLVKLAQDVENKKMNLESLIKFFSKHSKKL